MRHRLIPLLFIAAGSSACFALLDFSPFETSSAPREAGLDIDVAAFELGDVPLINVQKGHAVDVPIGITRGRDFTGSVALEVGGLPPWLTVTAAPAVADGQTTSTVTLTTSDAPTFFTEATVTITGTNGSVVKKKEVAVRVVGVPGTLDETFGSGGTVALTGLPSQGTSLSVENDGSLLIAGQTLVSSDISSGGTGAAERAAVVGRYDHEGRPSASFGDAGLVIVPGENAWARTVGDGILVAGTTSAGKAACGSTLDAMTVVKTSPNGGVVKTFDAGTAARWETYGYAGQGLRARGGLPGDGVVAAGDVASTAACDTFVTRLVAIGPDGKPLSGAGDGGVRDLVGTDALHVVAFVEGSDGDLLGTIGPDLAIMHVDGTGNIAPPTKLGGDFTDPVCGVREADGTTTLAAFGHGASDIGWHIHRIAADGRLDHAFPVDAGASLPIPIDRACRIATAPDGSHYVLISKDSQYRIYHFTRDGQWNERFGEEGASQPKLGGREVDWDGGLAVQADGRIVVVGTLGKSSSSPALVAARYWPRYWP